MTVSVKAPTSTTGSIQLNGSDVLTIDSSGNLTAPNDVSVTGDVGIGTSSPAYPLHVVTSNAVAGKIQSDRSGGFAYFDVQNTSTTVSGSAAIIRLITQNAAGTGTTSSDIYRLATGQFSINNNETNSAAFTSFSVGGTERMRIDSSGRVTMPYQPMAMINSNVTYNLPASTTEIVWTNVSVNVGSHYSTSTGRFTAPVAGKYLVTASFHGPATSGSRGYIARNGTQIKGWAGSVDADWGNFGTQVIADLSAGDYISVYIWAGNYVHGDPAWGGWSIQLIG